MAQVMQAACPGCKSVLRIPADWVNQPIRCKSCGTVIQARASTTPAAGPARKAPPPPPPPRAVRTPPPITAAPLAAPVVPRARAGSPFDFEEPDESPIPRRRPRRRSNAGLWIGVGLLAVFMLGIVGTLAIVLPKVLKTTQEPETAANQGGDDGRAGPKSGGDGPRKKPRAGGAEDDEGGPVVAGPGGQFPRRALIISVHNYLYANPVMHDQEGHAAVPRLISSLNRGLRIPLTQIFHVSDVAKKDPVPPLKKVIEQSLSNFLATSRKQDRLLVFFIGHAVEVDGEAYLVPLEGEFKEPATLIPLKWVFQKLAACPARQKVLVLDGNRFSAAQGEERPAAGPMSAKFEAALRAAPAGVQVWSACSAEQQSNEFDAAPLGVFLDSFRQALTPESGYKGALAGKIQKPNDLIPLDVLHERVVENMNRELEKRKLTQVAKLLGKAPASGADHDRQEALAKAPSIPSFKGQDQQAVKEILAEISLPPLKGGQGAGDDLDFTNLPPFPAEALKKYSGSLPADSKLRQACHRARVALWAVSTATPPRDLQGDVMALRQKLRFDLSIMRDRYSRPGGGAAENQFKAGVIRDLTAMARIVAQLEDVLEQLKEAGDEKDSAPARWKANYTYLLARFQAQLTYLEEYEGLLGQMRKEFPPMDEKVHSGWRMAAKEKATDSAAKKYFKAARGGYKELASKHRGTPWEVLGKREELTALGLDWQPY